MDIFCYTITKQIENPWEELEKLQIDILYSTESPSGKVEIFAKQNVKVPFAKVKKCKLKTIDWESQWNHFDFEVGGKILKLNSGPGFGDLSHPTTRLVLKMMTPYVKDCHVLDLGCGSGVLSIAAKALGARHVHGIDIDLDAIQHAKVNAETNGLDITFGLPEDYVTKAKSLIVLMNMITSEQEVALKSLPILNKIPCEFFISGVLEEENYERDWILKEKLIEDGWQGIHYSKP